jgi:hypothetical protein
MDPRSAGQSTPLPIQIVQNFILAQQKPQEGGEDSKMGLDREITNEFNQWGTYIQQEPSPKVELPKFELNVLDLDFLEGITGAAPAKSNLKKAPPPATPTKADNNQGYVTVPADVAKKLQEGNDMFIVGYNSHKISPNKPVETKAEKLQ